MSLKILSLSTDINNISTTSATIAYECSEASQPSNQEIIKEITGEDGEEKKEKTIIKYGTLNYSWSFGSTARTGKHTFTNLTKGVSNTIDVKVIAYCNKTTTVYILEQGDPIKDDDSGEPIIDPNTGLQMYEEIQTLKESSTESITIDEDDEEITVYTRPGNFTDYSFSTGTIIESSDGLTSSKVSDWCDHCGKYLSWLNQADNYSAANSCKVSSGDLITTEWINSCRALIDLDEIDDDQVISASLFNELGSKISIE